MGRLLKKKPAAKKRKKTEGAEGTVSSGNSAVAGKTSSGSTASGEVSKNASSIKIGTVKESGSKKNYIEISIQFLREVKAELKKVTWPSKKQTMGSTAVVIILVMAISFFLGLVDMGLSWLIRWVFNSLGA